MVAIDGENRVWIERREIDLRAVRPNIERLHAENPQGTVVIQADRNSTTDALIRVLDAARAAGVANVAVATREP
jgi:biopolymer transport protein ExbD